MSNQIKFYRGNVDTYNTMKTSTGFDDIVFFDTTNNIIYLNGSAYGASKTINDLLANGIVTNVVLSSSDTSGNFPMLSITKAVNGVNSTVDVSLFTIKSGSTAIGTYYNANSNIYDVSLLLAAQGTAKNSYNILKQTATGLYANVYLSDYDSTNHKYILYDAYGHSLGEINLSEFTKDKFLESGSVVVATTAAPVTVDGVKYTSGTFLKLILKTTKSGSSDTTTTIYINVADLITQYTAGNGITITDSDPSANSDKVGIAVNLLTDASSYLSFNASKQLTFNATAINAYIEAAAAAAQSGSTSDAQALINALDSTAGDTNKVLVKVNQVNGKLSSYTSSNLGAMILGSYTAPTGSKITSSTTLQTAIKYLDTSVINLNSRTSSLESRTVNGQSFVSGNATVTTNVISIDDDDRSIDGNLTSSASAFDSASTVSAALRLADSAISWHTLA